MLAEGSADHSGCFLRFRLGGTMAVRNKKQFNKLMQKQMKNVSKKVDTKNTDTKNTDTNNTVTNNASPGEPEMAQSESAVISLAKTTKLAFFKQYYTYQAFLEIHPADELSSKHIFAKTILYIMRWFRNRLGEDVFEKYPDTVFLRESFPEPEDYQNFKLEESKNIYGFSFIDFEAVYTNKRTAWLVRLTEPDNGNERKDIYGRNFTTEIFVHLLTDSVALGIRESCREPDTNLEDAIGYRPGFIRDMFFDKNLVITEYGLDKKYAFMKKPVMLNGKSGEACERMFSELIDSENRQMPILFVPGEFYKDNVEEVDKKTQSLLGFAHVVVWENTPAKLFSQTMKVEELNEVAGEGQLIFYRSTKGKDFPSDYYEPVAENFLETIKLRAQKEPCRKNISFSTFVFKPSWWEITKADDSEENELSVEELSNAYEKEISKLKIQIDDLRTDNDALQRKNDGLESDNRTLDKNLTKLFSNAYKCEQENEKLKGRIGELEDEVRRLEALRMSDDMMRKAEISEEKERYLPILNLPAVSKDKKDELIAWIEKYYSDVIELHPDAVKSLKDDNRNIDWHKLCMMIHYLYGYTRYRNEGGVAINPNAARLYDPEESGYKAEPTGSGQGSTEIHKDKYTIKVNGKDVLMDMHIKSGKGRDDNMIRIYFYYDPETRKSVIGHFPNHLPTRACSH